MLAYKLGSPDCILRIVSKLRYLVPCQDRDKELRAVLLLQSCLSPSVAFTQLMITRAAAAGGTQYISLYTRNHSAHFDRTAGLLEARDVTVERLSKPDIVHVNSQHSHLYLFFTFSLSLLIATHLVSTACTLKSYFLPACLLSKPACVSVSD